MNKLLVLQQRAREGTLSRAYVRGFAVNFLTDRRRAADPGGALAFRRLRDAVQKEVSSGRVRLVGGPDTPFRAHWILLESVAIGTSVETPSELNDCLESFEGRATMSQIFTMGGHGRRSVLHDIWGHLEALRVKRLRFQDLLEVLAPGRLRHAADVDPDSLPGRSELPDDTLARAHELLRKSDLGEPRRLLLGALLEELVLQASAGGGANLSAFAEEHGLDRRRVSELKRQLQKLLGVLGKEFEIQADMRPDRSSFEG